MGKFMQFLLNEDILEYTPEQESWFIDRTNKHIALVKKYAKLIEKYDPKTFKGLSERAETHDANKFEDPDRIPYIFISWQYHMKDLGKPFDINPATRAKMSEATRHHCKSNKHHPEYFDSVATINREDRDKPPAQIVDASGMSDIDIGEMLADWCAMGEEKGNTCKSWADANINKRWKFADEQIKLIYDTIDAITHN